MKTYVFVEKNGNATVTLSADDEKEANEYLKGLVRYPDAFRLDDTESEDDDCEYGFCKCKHRGTSVCNSCEYPEGARGGYPSNYEEE